MKEYIQKYKSHYLLAGVISFFWIAVVIGVYLRTTQVRGIAYPICGNGEAEMGEACDDGNLTDGDGCSAVCQTEAPAVCGNGTAETGETCDDGNQTTETCAYGLSSCMVCNKTCQSVSGAVSFCGDGILDAANNEQCDDGNLIPGDGCSDQCLTEPPLCAEPAVKITFNNIETVNAPAWQNQVVSGDKIFTLTENFVVIPLNEVQKFKSNLTNAFQAGWEGEGQEKHLRIGSMRHIPLNKKDRKNYGIELDYTVEFLGDVHVSKFIKMNTETGKETIIFGDGKIVYLGDRTDGANFLTGNGPGDDWSKYFLMFKNCPEQIPVYPPPPHPCPSRPDSDRDRSDKELRGKGCEDRD